MAGPYQGMAGLLTGIGGGLSIVPEAYSSGVDKGMARSMKELQLAELQRKAAEQRDIDTAYAMPKETPMVDTPVYETMNAAESAPGVAAPAYRQESPVGGGPVAPVDLPATIQNQIGTQKTPMDFAGKPFLRQQLEHQQVADRLRSMGRGRAAAAIEQQAGQYAAQHHSQMSKEFSRAAIMNDFGKMKSIAGELGYHTEGFGPGSKPGNISIRSKDAEGNPIVADMPLVALMDFDDPSKGAALINTLMWRTDATATRAATEEKKIASKESEGDKNRANKVEIAHINASRPIGLKGSATSTDERKVQARAQSFLDNDTTGQLTRTEAIEMAWDVIKPSIEHRGFITDKDELRSLDAQAKQMESNRQTKKPEYIEINRRREELRAKRGEKKPGKGSAPAAKTESGKAVPPPPPGFVVKQ